MLYPIELRAHFFRPMGAPYFGAVLHSHLFSANFAVWAIAEKPEYTALPVLLQSSRFGDFVPKLPDSGISRPFERGWPVEVTLPVASSAKNPYAN